jgi:uncharacterized membrane protein
MKMSLRVRRYSNVFLSAILPFLSAAVFTLPSFSLGLHWGQMNWLMQPLATLSLVLSPITWLIFLLMGISWARFKKLHKSIPILGLVIGPISLVPWITFVIPIILMLPAIILAVRLVIYHLEAPTHAQVG